MIATLARQAGTSDEARAAALIQDAISTGLISPLDLWPALRRAVVPVTRAAASQCRRETFLLLDADRAAVQAYADDLDAAARTIELEAERASYLRARELVRTHGSNPTARRIGLSGMRAAVAAFRELAT